MAPTRCGMISTVTLIRIGYARLLKERIPSFPLGPHHLNQVTKAPVVSLQRDQVLNLLPLRIEQFLYEFRPSQSLSVCFFLTFQTSAPDCGSNPGWRKNKNICYYYNDTDIVDFHTAFTRCYAEKARLVSILNREEQAYVNSMVCFFIFNFIRDYLLWKNE